MNYLYPRNLKEAPTLWLWSLKDIGLIGIGCVIAVLIYTQFKWSLPLVSVGVFAFLTIRFGDSTMMNFISYAVAYFMFESQTYSWEPERKIIKSERKL